MKKLWICLFEHSDLAALWLVYAVLFILCLNVCVGFAGWNG